MRTLDVIIYGNDYPCKTLVAWLNELCVHQKPTAVDRNIATDLNRC